MSDKQPEIVIGTAYELHPNQNAPLMDVARHMARAIGIDPERIERDIDDVIWLRGGTDEERDLFQALWSKVIKPLHPISSAKMQAAILEKLEEWRELGFFEHGEIPDAVVDGMRLMMRAHVAKFTITPIDKAKRTLAVDVLDNTAEVMSAYTREEIAVAKSNSYTLGLPTYDVGLLCIDSSGRLGEPTDPAYKRQSARFNPGGGCLDLLQWGPASRAWGHVTHIVVFDGHDVLDVSTFFPCPIRIETGDSVHKRE